MKIYKVYYYAEGDVCLIGYYTTLKRAKEKQSEGSLNRYIDEIEVKE